MKTKTLIMTALVALMAAACGKDNNGRLNLVVENMNFAGNSKFLFDPANINDAQWMGGESININGTSFSITANNGDCQVDAGSLNNPTNYYAIYPATVAADGNNITVTNNNNNGGSVVIESLLLNFHNDGTHEVYFPMVGNASNTEQNMPMKHLTAGMKFTLQNNRSSAIDLSTLKIVTQTASASAHIAAEQGVTAQWAVQGPIVPGGEVGSLTDEDMKYSCQMLFRLKNEGGNDYVTIPANGSITFCVPVTISSVKTINVVGYNTDNTESFTKSTTSDNAITIERNTMYNMSTITIN